MATALLIDDSKQARDFLHRDLQQYCPLLTNIYQADGVLSGLKALQQHKPDIVFLDIHMGDGTGFDLLKLQPTINFKLIFTTASDAHAIKAFKFSAIDYLLKPIDTDELQQAVKKALAQQHNSEQALHLLKENLKDAGNHSLQKLALRTQDKIHICQVTEVMRCQADNNYTHFWFTQGKPLLVTKTLKHFDQLLQGLDFCRVHQSHLINLNEVKEFVKSDGGYLVMKDGSRIPVSSRKRNEVVDRIMRL